MKQIKLKTDKPIRGIARKSGDIINVSTDTSVVSADRNTIGILCAEDLIRRGDAVKFEEKTSKS